MVEQLRHEVADVEAEHRAFAHRGIAQRRGVEPAVVAERDAAIGKKAAAQIGVLTVELDALIETADAVDRELRSYSRGDPEDQWQSVEPWWDDARRAAQRALGLHTVGAEAKLRMPS